MPGSDQLVELLSLVGLRPGRSGDYLRMWCPFHENPNGKTLWVAHKTGHWGCFSTRCSMHSGGNLQRLLTLRGITPEAARSTVDGLRLSDYEPVRKPNTLKDRDYAGAISEAHVALWYVDWGLAAKVCAEVFRYQDRYDPNAPLRSWAPSVPVDPGQVEHDAWQWLWYPLVVRGLSPSALELMDVGFDPAAGALTFPIRGPEGDVRGVARRECADGKDYIIDGCCWPKDDPRHTFVPCPKGDTFFGWTEMLPRMSAGQPVIIAEGYADQLRLAGFGLCAIAKLGRMITKDQAALLASVNTQKILWPDFDRDGLMGAKADINRLREQPVRVVTDHGGLKDAGSLQMSSGLAARIISSASHPLDWMCALPNLLASLG